MSRKNFTELSYKVTFNTPAFLGNTEQQAQWRTPPFKVLLRQWWRIVKAKDCGYDYSKLRDQENILFGMAADGNATKSRIKLRLSHAEQGRLRTLESSGKVHHPEVGRGGNDMPIEANLYLGYGPVTTRGLKNPPAIDADKHSAELWLGIPNEHASELQQAMQLAQWFGTLGSRSRNAWGSLSLEPDETTPDFQSFNANNLTPFSRSLADCLSEDWPHALGSDQQGVLIWVTQPKNSWGDAMKELAKIKIELRTSRFFKFPTEKPRGEFHHRHLLSYPVTNHTVTGWQRLGNQLRFKVIKHGNKYAGLISHFPCGLPSELANSLSHSHSEIKIWQEAHKVLDSSHSLQRLK